jgi:2'-5' RNA ligase
MTENMPEIRAFIAVDLPEEAKTFLADISSRLRSFGGDVKWVRTSGIHLTLKFLGNVRPEVIPQLDDAVRPLFADQAPVELAIQSLGAFPGLRKARVIWAGVRDPGQRLAGIAAHIDDLVEQLGFKREKRRFSPHLTLGRVRSQKGNAQLVDGIRQMMDAEGPRFVADHAVLFQSILKPSGAEYKPLRRFDFTAP